MATDNNRTEEVELNDKMRAVPTHNEHSRDSSPVTATQTGTGMSKQVWLACIALSFSYTTAFQQNSCTAAIVKHIDTELGPTEYYNWILSAYTMAVSVSLPLSGGLSDIFGRRWFFIVGCLISLTGTAIALGAQNVPMVIVGMIMKGIGSGSQQLALAAIAELVPNKHRGHAQAVLDLVTLPWAVFGALIGNAMVKFHHLSFRINFIIGVILNIISIATIYLWYHPPGGKVVEGKSTMARLLELDWIGVIFMALGIVLTLMGLAFGGNQLPWNSAGVIAPIVIGVLSLIALGIWEWKFAKYPFFAHELFVGKARTFTLLLVITFVGGMSLYTAAAFWTQQCQGMFTTDPIKIGVSAIPGGVGGAVGGFFGGVLVGKHFLFKSNYILIYSVVIKLVADGLFTTVTPNTFSAALGFGFLAMFGVGLMLVALIVCVQLAPQDSHIGLATLVIGSIRSIGGSVAITVYTSIMMNTVKKDAGPRIAKVVLPMGLPRTSLEPLVKLLLGGKTKDLAKIPGINMKIIEAAANAAKWSWTLAFQRIYYAAIAFSTVGLIASFFVKDITHMMNDNIAVTLTNEEKRDEKGRVLEA